MSENINKGKKKKKGKQKVRKRISHQVMPKGMNLEDWQVALRRQVAREERLLVATIDDKLQPGEYMVTNPKTEQQYKVVYRGANSQWNYCSCFDFRTSQLGTCKHIEALKLTFGGRRKVHRELPPYSSVYIDYRQGRQVRIRIGCDNSEAFKMLANDYFDEHLALKPTAYAHFHEFLAKARELDAGFRCYPDALQYVVERRENIERAAWVDALGQEDFNSLLHTRLYPYQVEGIKFALKAGKSIIADEMGLGKTIQAIATAQMLRRKALVGNVLIVCPTSLKYQWKREIERFTGETVHVIEGDLLARCKQYEGQEPYRIISYNALSNDLKLLKSIEVDMLVRDEVQRLKNWNTHIARAARKVNAQYAVVLSGTPLENRLEELYSVAELVDQFALSPYYKFKDRYIMLDERGATAGYRNLNELGERIKRFLIRRRKRDVNLQMPERQDKLLFVPMTKQQMVQHDEARWHVSVLLKKWQNMHFLSETDRNRLMKHLSQMRMLCDSTYILDQKTRFDTKVTEVINIVRNVIESGDEKLVVFSQWERMTRLVAKELEKEGIGFEYLHGGIPSIRRKDLVNNFMDEPHCRVFLSTDAGSTGLNLQAASVVVNIDLPWNPAVLEQRIARVYRMGQKRNIQVINLVSAGTFEEDMLDKLKFKSSLFEGVLDGGEDTIFAQQGKFDEMMAELNKTMGSSADTHTGESPIDNDEQEQVVGNETMEDNAPETNETEVFDDDDLAENEEETRNNEESEARAHTIANNDGGNTNAERARESKTPQGEYDNTTAVTHLDFGTPTGDETEDNAAEFEDNAVEHGDETAENKGFGHADTPKNAAKRNANVTPTHAQSSRSANPSTPKELVHAGRTFFQGLADTLKSPEATRQLVEELVEEDPETGATHIKIAIPDKKSVEVLLGFFGSLLAANKSQEAD